MRKLLGIILVIFLAGCSPIVNPEQPVRNDSISLGSADSLGQTFKSQYAGLNGMELYLEPNINGEGRLHLVLRDNSIAGKKLYESSVPINHVTQSGYYRFNIAPHKDSNQEDYYVILKVKGSGSVKVGVAPGNSYLEGAFYRNNQAQNRQLNFRLVYAPRIVLVGIAGEILRWILYLLVTVYVYVLPGLALLVLLLPNTKDRYLHAWVSRAALSIGISFALYPLLFLITDLIGLHLGPLYAWVPGLLGFGILISRYPPKVILHSLSSIRQKQNLWANLTLLIVLALVFGTRFWSIRTLEAPMWGDAVHHSMITQLLVDNSGLFDSWEPYAQLSTFTYHFGFHSNAAVFHWITRLPVHKAVLWIGQILNGLAALALYPLAKKISNSHWAGLGATITAGLLAPMPMFYVNWGRYTQLTGQVILPIAIILIWVILENQDHPSIWVPENWRFYTLIWICLAGLALSHYRVLIFALLFFPTYLLFEARKGTALKLLIRTLWIGVGAGLLFLPWFIRVFSGKIISVLTNQLSTPAEAVSNFTQRYNTIGDLFSYLPPTLWFGLIVVIGWGLWRRNRGFALLSTWWFLILIAANPSLFSLPGTGAISNFAVFIAFYIPAVILLGSGFSWLISWFMKQNHPWMSYRVTTYSLITLLIIGISLWGARQRLDDVKVSSHSIITSPDVKAMTWIKENVPEDAKFLVNAFFAYDDTVIVGSDGGWWIPLLAHRDSTLPPINYGVEQGHQPDYWNSVNAFQAEIQNKHLDQPEVLAALIENGVTHIYIGQQRGRVNNKGSISILNINHLLKSDKFRTIYHQDRVAIFEYLP
ncbi:MAG: hypothetical protein PVG32_20840 [Anaerolineales bacterium]|jgi:hypothetical protein